MNLTEPTSLQLSSHDEPEIQDTGNSVSLKTRVQAEAVQKVNAMNETERQLSISLGLARVYLNVTDPKLATRTWQEVMDHLVAKKKDDTKVRPVGTPSPKPRQRVQAGFATKILLPHRYIISVNAPSRRPKQGLYEYHAPTMRKIAPEAHLFGL